MLSGNISISMNRCVKLQNCFAGSAANVDCVLVIILQKTFLLHFVFPNCILLLGGHNLNVYLKCGE